MLSRTFALFLRALRVDARILPPHLMRMALLMFVGVTLFYAQVLGIVMGAPGLLFFAQISWINYVFANLAAAFLFASAITEEKEERSLGLLRMAGVSPLPLLVGKSAPRLVAALLILCVQFPFTLLAITLGGVTWIQVAAAFCTLVAHVVLIGSIALLFSVILRRTGTAIVLTFAVMACLIIIPPFLVMTLRPPWGSVRPPDLSPVAQFLMDYALPVLDLINDASAASRLSAILGTGFNESPIGFQVLTNTGIGLILFGLAWLIFDPCNRNPDDEVGKSTPLTRLFRTRRRSRRAWRLAIVGKDFRAQAGGWIALFVKLGAYVSVIALLTYVGNDFRWSRVTRDDLGIGLCITALYFLLPIETMLVAARLFRTELKERTWPILLSLPLSLPEIAYAKLAGALAALAPATFCFCAGMMFSADDTAELLENMFAEPASFLLVGLYVGYLLLLGHLTACFSVLSNAWVGALMGMVGTVMIFFINYMFAMMPVFYLSFGAGGAGPNDIELYLTVAGVVSLGFVLVLSGCLHMLIGMRLKSAAAQ